MANAVGLSSQFTHIALTEEDLHDEDDRGDNYKQLSTSEKGFISDPINIEHGDVNHYGSTKCSPGSAVPHLESAFLKDKERNASASPVEHAFSWNIGSGTETSSPKNSKLGESSQQLQHPVKSKNGGESNYSVDKSLLITAESYFPSLASMTKDASTCQKPIPLGCDTCQRKRQVFWRSQRHTSGGSNGSSEGCGEFRPSSIDGLLFEIYDRWQRDSFDSDTFTECSSTSDAFLGRVDSVQHHLEEKHGSRLSRATLLNKGIVLSHGKKLIR